MHQVVCYEHPLNERIRSLLRLEFLFKQVNHAVTGYSSWDSRTALQGLFDLLALTGRTEFKRDLIKELERHGAILNRLRQTPGVDITTLDKILAEIGAVVGQVHGLDNLALEMVRQTDFLSAIYKRSQIPGGTCRFDLPAFYHWLRQEPSIRTAHLQEWLAPLLPLQQATTLFLRLIRDSAIFRSETAVQGFFQRGLDSSGAPHQLIRILLPPGSPLFPEISGGRHRFAIHFLEQPSPNRRAVQSSADIVFELACCAI